MKNYDVIIVGAGAAGLIAARNLSVVGLRVIVLEGRHRLGGRVYTDYNPAFTKPVELGAEFIHGNLPVTQQLLNEYGIHYSRIKGSFESWREGKWIDQKDEIEQSALLEKPLKNLTTDISVEEFLQQLPDDEKHVALKNSVRKFVQGYDSADTTKASALAFKKEWLGQDEEQYRIEGGYGALMTMLANECRQKGCLIATAKPVKRITWQKKRAEIVTGDGEEITGTHALITLPLGMLQLPAGEGNSVTFTPDIEDKRQAALRLGYGPVIKVVMEFKSAFWKSAAVHKHTGKNLSHLGFVFTDTPLPTWWTQYPDSRPLLTCWLGGPEAEHLKDITDKDMLTMAINVLALIFNIERTFVEEQLIATEVVNWAKDKFACGAYSYVVVNDKHYRKILCAPEKDTLFFAGEAYNKDGEIATVEAALKSGLNAAKLILKLFSL